MSPGVSCPWCGRHGSSVVVDHPEGRFFCSCGSLHFGSDAEWRRLAPHRLQNAQRRAEWLAAHPQVARVDDDHVLKEAS